VATKVLIVDDDPVTTDQFSRVLSLSGCHVRKAYNAVQGLEEAVRERPDVLILDLHMAIMDGLEMLERLRSFGHLGDVPVAIVTGDYFIEDDTRQKLQTLGAHVWFKPLWVEDLVAIVNGFVLPGSAPAPVAKNPD
jgi:two-component system OmpR family response regulator